MTFPSIYAINMLKGEHDDPNFTGLIDANMKPIPLDWYYYLDLLLLLILFVV